MKSRRNAVCCCLLIWISCGCLTAQQAATSSSTAVVPRLVNFSGKAVDGGKVITGPAGATFAIYSEEAGGSPLWMETQNVTADPKGNYTVQLGATKPEGLPLDLFTSGEARWLGVTINGGTEQPRVLLLSVPYALKAADAQTLGGLPASAFQLAGTANTTTTQPGVVVVAAPSSLSASPATSSDVTTTGGTANTLPLFTTATNVQSSILAQTGSGTTGKIGFNTTTPATLLDVNGGATVRGTLALATTGTATATAGKNSQPLDFTASSYNSSTAAAVAQKFQWQAEPAANDTTAPTGTMNLLYAAGTATPAETGLKINSKGQITFATGQTFPGGAGTITGVTAGTDLTGGGTSGTVTLNVDTTKVPLLAAANTFTGNQTVNGKLTATGVVTAGSYQIGSYLFAFGSYDNSNSFLGFAGNSTMTGPFNVGTGSGALYSNTTGNGNTATGAGTLLLNTTGNANTADGEYTLYSNTTGGENTAIGTTALFDNSTGSYNTAAGVNALSNGNASNNDAFGYEALLSNTTGSPNEAFGYEALFSNTTGSENAAFGYQAMYIADVGGANSAFGFQAMNNSVGFNNSAFGYQALYGGGTAYAPQDSSAFGYRALFSNTSGTNDAFGYQALVNNSSGNENAAFGYIAMQSNTTGGFNAAFGENALISNTTGSQNTGVGVSALGVNATGSELTCIGAYCNAPANINNATAIGAHALVEQSNSLVLGAVGINVGIGTTKPSNILTIGRGAGHPVSDSWETYSSRRWKTNIHPLENALGKVEQLRGVSYTLKASGKHEIGVIAEEVGAVVPEVVSFEENGKDARGVDYSRLTALLIEAVKQQQKQIAAQAGQVRLLRSELKRRATKEAALESRLRQLEQHRGSDQVASVQPSASGTAARGR